MTTMRGLTVLLLLAGCGCQQDSFAPDEPFTALIPPPAHYVREYDWVLRHCTRTVRLYPAYQFPDLTFYRVNTGDTFTVRVSGKVVAATGYWERDKIYLVPEAVTQSLPLVLRHELLHAQLGHGGHPPVFAYCEALSIAEGLPRG